MAKYFLHIFLFCFGSEFCFGQNFEWATQMCEFVGVPSVTTDEIGNVYTTAPFQLTHDFDNGAGTFNLTSFGGKDIFISKLDINGNFVWAKQLGGTLDESSSVIIADKNGYIYINGTFNGTADFDPGPGVFNLTSFGGIDGFVCKLDTDGNFVWAIQLGGTSLDVVKKMSIGSSGEVYVTGYFASTADFDPGPSAYNLVSAGGYDIFVCKLDAFGNFIWAKKIGSTGEDYSNGITLDNLGRVCITGSFSATVDFDPDAGIANLTSSGGSEIYVAKLMSSGDFIWAKKMGGTLNDDGISIITDSLGNIYSSGNFSSNSDFDPSSSFFFLNSHGTTDVYLSKLDSLGNFIWAKHVGGFWSDLLGGLDLDESNNVYINGSFQSSVDFNPGAGTYTLTATLGGATEAFILKLSTDGNFVWARKFGSIGNDRCTSISIDDYGAILSTGSFSGLVDFDPEGGIYNLTSTSAQNVFVQKLVCDTTYSSINITSCFSYDVPSGDETYFTSGIYSDTILNISGCDSIITISLTIAFSTNSNFVVNECTFYTVPSGDETYLVSGVYSDTIPNSMGCDSVMTITANIIPPTTNAFSISTCNAYAVPSGDETYLSPGVYSDTIPNSTGCDSILTITITQQETFSSFTVSQCSPYSVPSGNETYFTTGIYSDTIPNSTGCDSIITIHYFTGSSNSINVNSCGPYTVPSGDETYTTSGTYMDTLISFSGCDSILEIDLEIFASPNVLFAADTMNSCAPANINFVNLTSPSGMLCTWQFGDGATANSCGVISHNYSSGVFDVTLTVTGINGCIDSATYLNYITVAPSPSLIDIDDEICDSTIYNFVPFGTNLSDCTFNWYVDFPGPGVSFYTGDSLSIPVFINLPGYQFLFISYSATNLAGCVDTTGNYYVIVKPLPTVSFVADILIGCAPLSVDFTNTSLPSGDNCIWNFGDGNTANSCGSTSNIYLNPGTYDVSLKVITLEGCMDSTVYNSYITVMPGNASSATINPVTCDSYTSPSGNVLTASGIYTDVISNTVGCDSSITINLTINNLTSSTQNLTACNNLISPSGNYLWTSSGTYNDTIPNTNGCDSLITINLTINSADNLISQSGATLTANATGAIYQWLDCNNAFAIIAGETGQSFTPTINGNYAASITENGCTDTSACIAINDVGIFENNESSVLVYPNPSSGKFTIVLKDLSQEKVDFQITNSLGQVVYTSFLTSSENQKEINLASGIYYLKINSGDKLETIELIVTD